MNPKHKSQFRNFRRPRHITARPKSAGKMSNHERVMDQRLYKKSPAAWYAYQEIKKLQEAGNATHKNVTQPA